MPVSPDGPSWSSPRNVDCPLPPLPHDLVRARALRTLSSSSLWLAAFASRIQSDSVRGVATLATVRAFVQDSLPETTDRFKAGSAVPADELDAAYEYASTPPRLRDAEDEAEEEGDMEEAASDEDEAADEAGDEDTEEDTEEDEEPRRRGWLSWIPGL